MKRAICIALLSIIAAFSIIANAKKKQPITLNRIYLECNALTTSYTFSELRGTIAGCLTQNGYILVHSADEADWTIQVVGSCGAQKQTAIGSSTLYTTDVIVSIMIDRGAYAKRVFETNLKAKGKHLADFDEAAVDAYTHLSPQICETIMQQIAK